MPVNYANLIQEKLDGSLAFANSLNNMIEIPDGAQKGAITCSILTSSTAETPVDGTLLTNATATTEVVLTYVNQVVPLSLPETQIKSMLTSPAWLDKISKNHASALLKAGNAAVIADMVGGTPGSSDTLAAARIDFKPGTEAQNLVMLGQVIAQISYLQTEMAMTPGLDEIGIVMGPTAYGNFTTIRSSAHTYTPIFGNDGLWRFMGIPIFPVSVTTSFGGAGNDCMYIYHETAEAFAFKNPGLLGGKVFLAGDGHWKFVTSGPFAAGLCEENLYAAITNPAS